LGNHDRLWKKQSNTLFNFNVLFANILFLSLRIPIIQNVFKFLFSKPYKAYKIERIVSLLKKNVPFIGFKIILQAKRIESNRMDPATLALVRGGAHHRIISTRSFTSWQ
jgi:hypothetical protein